MTMDHHTDAMGVASPTDRPATPEEDRRFLEGGYARASYVRSALWDSVYRELESLSRQFVSAAWREGSQGYFWPLDPLHWWSRTWEYPFVAWHLRQGRRGAAAVTPRRLLDVGSAVTFFSYHLLREGFDLTCLDANDTMPGHFERVGRLVTPALWSGAMPKYVVADARDTKLSSSSFDAVICVSVLEHIPGWQDALREMMRVLAPGGQLVLTLDVKRNETSSGLSEAELGELLGLLDGQCELTTHREVRPPEDAIDTLGAPMPTPPPPRDLSSGPSLARRLVRGTRATVQRLRHRMEGRPPENIAIFGGVWRKKG